MLTLPSLVIPSVFNNPVSIASWTPSALGATVSIEIAGSVRLVLLFPATSVAVTEIERLPSAGTSEERNVTDHIPSAPTGAAVLTTEPQVTTTEEPGSNVPVTVTPAVFSARLTTSSLVTWSITSSAALVSIFTAVAFEYATLSFPAASVCRTRICPIA